MEITGKFLNVYGQGSLRYIDKPWNQSKSNDVSTIKFNYVGFNSLVPVFSKIKNRFPNAENYFFRDTNIYCLGQLNALADLQGLVSLYIHEDGNPITRKEWHTYAIYRLSHWGLKFVNDHEVCKNYLCTHLSVLFRVSFNAVKRFIFRSGGRGINSQIIGHL